VFPFPSQFGRLNETVRRVFSTHLSTICSPHQELTPLKKSASKRHIRRLGEETHPKTRRRDTSEETHPKRHIRRDTSSGPFDRPKSSFGSHDA
jgi:hypothetical protein